MRFFRKDGHNWRKKSDGKTVRETHEKLKARNPSALHRLAAVCVACLQRSHREGTSHCAASALQVGNRDALNCYYAHAEEKDSLQVRPAVRNIDELIWRGKHLSLSCRKRFSSSRSLPA